jgi:hypothetical protein
MSITSMSNRARMAEDLTIQQLQQSIQDGVVPSYIGVPLLKSKVEDAKLLQAAKAAQSMGQQPSVAQQIMSQAQQVSQPAPQMAPQAGVEGLSTNLPASMAGGGIVAFAEGGMYDEDDSDEDRQDAARQAEMDEMMDEYAQSFQQGIGQLPAAQQYAPAEGKEDASDFVARIMHKESRGRRYGKDGQLLTSEKGAQGEMQVMPGTSRDPGFGVKPARDDSPDELARVGRDYANTLLARYGDPKLAAIAYNMGPGATDKWLAAGADVSKLPKETQGYVKGFSGEDGDSLVEEKKRKGIYPYNSPDAGKFMYGDTLDEDAKKALAFTSAPFAAAGDVLLSPITALRKAVRNPLDRSESPSWSPLYDARNRYLYGDEKKAEVAAKEDKGLPEVTRGRPTMANDPRLIGSAKPEVKLGTQGAAPAPVADVVTAAEAPAKADPYAKFEELFAKREENLAKQREQDKYMAMLQAGLGMMGGTSQHALANIGAGGQQGIQALAQSNAARTAEENALLSGRLGLAKIGGAKEQAEAMMQLRRDLQKDALAQRGDQAKTAEAGRAEARDIRIDAKQIDYIKSAKESALAQATKLVNSGNAAMTMTDEQKAEAVQNTANKLLMNDNLYRGYVKNQHGKDPFANVGGTINMGPIPPNAVRLKEK